MTSSVLHDLIFHGERRKNTVGREGREDTAVDEADIENVLSCNPIVEFALTQVLAKCFHLESLVQPLSKFNI